MRDFEVVLEAGSRVTESPVWDDVRRRVVFADITHRTRGRLVSFDVDTRRVGEWMLCERVTSLGVCGSGRLVVALPRHVAIFDPETLALRRITPELDEPPGNHFNDGKVGPDGCFWVGTRDARRDDGRVPDGNGSLYRVTPDGEMEWQATGVATSNGLAWTADGRHLLQSDSHNGHIFVHELDPLRGQVSATRLVRSLTDAEGRPDGAACDDQGGYWSAGVSAGRLNRLSIDGDLLDVMRLPVRAPTMPCFAEEDLFLTSIRRPGADPHDARFAGGGLMRTRAPGRGVPIGHFDDA
jgi:sugar lactone lactonase YvrE